MSSFLLNKLRVSTMNEHIGDDDDAERLIRFVKWETEWMDDNGYKTFRVNETYTF